MITKVYTKCECCYIRTMVEFPVDEDTINEGDEIKVTCSECHSKYVVHIRIAPIISGTSHETTCKEGKEHDFSNEPINYIAGSAQHRCSNCYMTTFPSLHKET